MPLTCKKNTIGHEKCRQRRQLLFFRLTSTFLLFSTWSTSTTAFFNLVNSVDVHFTAFFITPDPGSS